MCTTILSNYNSCSFKIIAYLAKSSDNLCNVNVACIANIEYCFHPNCVYPDSLFRILSWHRILHRYSIRWFPLHLSESLINSCQCMERYFYFPPCLCYVSHFPFFNLSCNVRVVFPVAETRIIAFWCVLSLKASFSSLFYPTKLVSLQHCRDYVANHTFHKLILFILFNSASRCSRTH